MKKPNFVNNRNADLKYIKEENNEFNDIFNKIVNYIGYDTQTDTFTLQQAALQLLGPKRFVGVFPFDKLPSLKNGQSAILNTDPHDKPGEHWVAIYRKSKTQFYFFDSYGRDWRNVIPNLKYIKTIGLDNDVMSAQTVRQFGLKEYCGQMSLSFLVYLYAQPKPAMAMVI